VAGGVAKYPPVTSGEHLRQQLMRTQKALTSVCDD
jgi:hypothetical protein